MKWSFLVMFCVFCAANAQAATVFKCVDAAGKTTFTQQNCPENHSLEDVVRARNPTISGSGPAARMARPVDGTSSLPSSISQPSQRATPRVNVVGASAPQPGCSTGLNDRDLRAAKVRGEVVTGMTRGEVESIYGSPNRNPSTRGAGRSTYWNDKYLSATSVSYDRNGCVRSTYQSGHNGR